MPPLIGRLRLIAALTLVFCPGLMAAAPPVPGPASPKGRPRAAVHALLNRAASVPDDQALQSLDEAARLAESIPDRVSEWAVARLALRLGNQRDAVGDLAGARDLYQRAVAMQEKLEPDSLGVASTLDKLGTIARVQRDLVGARDLFQRALVIQRKRAPHSLALALTLDRLGTVLRMQQDLVGARDLYQRALAIQEQLAPASMALALSLTNLGTVAQVQGDPAQARNYCQRALAIQEKLAPNSLEVAFSLTGLGNALDESGIPPEAIADLRRALQILDQKAPDSRLVPLVLRHLARLLLESGASAEAAGYLKRAEQIEEESQSLSSEPVPAAAGSPKPALPQVRFLEPRQNSEVQGEAVNVTVAFLSPRPPARYRVWINGRPFGGEEGFSLSTTGDKGRLLDKGRMLEKSLILDKGRMLEKGPMLEKGNNRETLAGGLPPEVAVLIRNRRYRYFQQLRLTLPVEETDGAFLRIAIAAEARDGSASVRQFLHLRRPQAEADRGPLRVLAIGVGAYANARVPQLHYAAADASDLAAAFQAQAGPDKLYRSAEVKVLTDVQATLPAMRQALAWFSHDVQPGETLILVLSGHGLKAGEKYYFAPVNLAPANIGGTGLPWTELLQQLEAARQKAKAVWVLADCCRAAPGLEREQQATGRDLRQGVEEGGNLLICTAAQGDRSSYESEDVKHGLFTQAWLEALRGDWLARLGPEAADLIYPPKARGRVLTLSGLQTLLEASVSRHARRAGVAQDIEFPRLEGNFSPSQPVFVPVRGS